jgi:hypothetical protein
MKKQIVQHLRTNVKDKKPTSSDILNGEIAINYAADGETLPNTVSLDFRR